MINGQLPIGWHFKVDRRKVLLICTSIGNILQIYNLQILFFEYIFSKYSSSNIYSSNIILRILFFKYYSSNIILSYTLYNMSSCSTIRSLPYLKHTISASDFQSNSITTTASFYHLLIAS